MPRGSKVCSKCNYVTGPRSFACPKCNNPFVIKGKVADLESIVRAREAKIGASKSREDDKLKIKEYMKEIDYSQDPLNLRVYGGKARTWESPDGMYRIRYAKYFMGITLPDNVYFALIRKSSIPNMDWELVGRGKSMQKVLRGYIRVINGLPYSKPVDKKMKRKKSLKRMAKALANDNS